MKRESSPASPSPDALTTPPPLPTPTPTPKKAKTTPKKAATPKKAGGATNAWTPDKRELFIDRIIATGYKSANLDALAAELDLTKRQLIDQLVPNRSNLRSKAAKMARGDSA
ncbi:hypothetical protein Q5752_002163 [Cryptotrichosporon argae]